MEDKPLKKSLRDILSWHNYIRFFKSGSRIGACAGAIFLLITMGSYKGVVAAILLLAIGFLIAEIWGIFEEWK